MRIASSCVVLLGLATAGVASAAEQEFHEADNARPVKATRRSDFALGLSPGFAFGRASGYPNKIQKIGDEAYRSNTDLGVGGSNYIWLGVAFNDYLTFGLGFGGIQLTGNDRKGTASMFGFHVDAYPLFDLGTNLRDLAVFGQAGMGPLKITGGPEDADGGLMSYLEAGVAYERLRLWRIAIGPSVSVAHLWSESADLTAGRVALRATFYGGP